MYLCTVRAWALHSWDVWHVQQTQYLRTGVIVGMQLNLLMFHAYAKHLSALQKIKINFAKNNPLVKKKKA